MKFTQLPKKLVLTGMSAAMVVAFAPAIASAEVYQDPATSAKTATSTPDKNVIATLTYTTGGNDYTQKFKSDQNDPTKANYTADDAIQAALTAAAQVADGNDKVTDVKVTLASGLGTVTVGNVKDSALNKDLATNDDGLIASGDGVTIDLNGNTLTNTKAGNGTVDTQTITVEGTKTPAVEAGTQTKTTTGTAVFYDNGTNITASTKDEQDALTKAQNEAKEAKTALENAKTARDTALAAKEDANKAYNDAKTEADTAKAKADAKEQALNTAKNDYAAGSISSKKLAEAQEAYDSAKADYDAKEAVLTATNSDGKTLEEVSDEADAAFTKADTDYKTAESNKTTKDQAVKDAQNALSKKIGDIQSNLKSAELQNGETYDYQDVAADDKKSGYTITGITVEPVDNNVYAKVNGRYTDAHNLNTDMTGETAYSQYKVTITYTISTAAVTSKDLGAAVTIVNGTVTSATQQQAIVVNGTVREAGSDLTAGNASEYTEGKDTKTGASLTLGKGAVVTTTKAEAAVQQADAGYRVNKKRAEKVTLLNGATVTATLDAAADNNGDSYAGLAGDQGSVFGVDANDVVIGTAEDKDKHNYTDSQANVTATLSNGVGGAGAVGINADAVNAYATNNVTASATAKDEQHADQTTPIIGIIDDNHDQAGNRVSSVAVLSKDKSNLYYGNYKGEFAVVAGYGLNEGSGVTTMVNTDAAGLINFGTYDGYVWNAANTNITGGKFKYDPTKEVVNRKGDRVALYQSANKLNYANPTFTKAQFNYIPYRAASNNGWTYVYRVGYATVDYPYVNGAHESGSYVKFQVPESAKDANGDKYGNTVYNDAGDINSSKKGAYKDSLTAYVQDNYLDAVTQQLVFSEQGIGLELNDGNDFSAVENRGVAQPTLNVALTGRYVTPTAEASKEAGYETAYNELKAQADANTQTAQGIYVVSAEQQYGYVTDKKGNLTLKEGEAQPIKVADIDDLGDAKIAVKAKMVTTYADAKAYKLGETNEEYALTAPAAVGTTIDGYATFETAKAGAYGITVTTTSDAVKQAQAKADAAKAEAEAKAKAAEQAAADAKAAAEKEAAEAQAKADAAQKAADEAKAQLAKQQAQAKQAKAVAKAKAKKVKGLKVKVGKKKATVSWKKVKGAVKYQVKYRQKNSSKTADFKYKTVKSTKYTAKKLKTGKYYNFKVRVYTKAGSKNVAGKWTSIVTGKIK